MIRDQAMSKNRTTILSIFFWIAVGSIFFTIMFLPMIVGIPSKAGILWQRTLPRAFCSLILCYPYIRAAIFLGKGSKFITAEIIPLSEYQKNNMAWAYYFEITIPILSSLILLFLALKNLTEFQTMIHYLALILFGFSLICLEIGIGKLNIKGA